MFTKALNFLRTTEGKHLDLFTKRLKGNAIVAQSDDETRFAAIQGSVTSEFDQLSAEEKAQVLAAAVALCDHVSQVTEPVNRVEVEEFVRLRVWLVKFLALLGSFVVITVAVAFGIAAYKTGNMPNSSIMETMLKEIGQIILTIIRAGATS